MKHLGKLLIVVAIVSLAAWLSPGRARAAGAPYCPPSIPSCQIDGNSCTTNNYCCETGVIYYCPCVNGRYKC
jgi:hypothetical protein